MAKKVEQWNTTQNIHAYDKALKS